MSNERLLEEDLNKLVELLEELHSLEESDFDEFSLEELELMNELLESIDEEQLNEEYLEEAGLLRKLKWVGKSLANKTKNAVEKAKQDVSDTWSAMKANPVNTTAKLGAGIVGGAAKGLWKAHKGLWGFQQSMPKQGFSDLDHFIDFYNGKMSGIRPEARGKRAEEAKRKNANKLARQERLGLTPTQVQKANSKLNKAKFLKKKLKPTEPKEKTFTKKELKLRPSDVKKANKGLNKDTFLAKPEQGMTKQKLKAKVKTSPATLIPVKPEKSLEQKVFDKGWKKQKAQSPKQMDMFGKSPEMMPEPKAKSGLKIKSTGRKTASGKLIIKPVVKEV